MNPTPGPWTYGGSFSRAIYGNDGQEIAKLYTRPFAFPSDEYEWKANAVLIAAAPDMESILTRLTEKVERANEIQHNGVRICAEDWAEIYMLTNEARGILSKARGE